MCAQLLLLLWLSSAGQALSQPYEPQMDKCLNQHTHYVNSNVNKCCSKCPPGHRRKSECTSLSDTVCEACPEGTFNEKMTTFPNCFRCTKCSLDKGMLYKNQCNSTTNAQCECMEGHYCSIKGYPKCSQCSPFIECRPGYGVSVPGGADTNVKCEICQNGTFSDLLSSTQRCQPHTHCAADGRSTVGRGNTTSDTVCGPYTVTLVRGHSSHSSKMPAPTMTSTVTSSSSLTNISDSVRQPDNSQLHLLLICVAVAAMFGGLLAVCCVVYRCRNTGAAKKPDPEVNKFLPEEVEPGDPSISSSSSSRSVWTGLSGNNRPDELTANGHHVNICVTTTVNYSLPPNSPPGPSPPQLADSDLPLSTQEEDSTAWSSEKDSREAVQETTKILC